MSNPCADCPEKAEDEYGLVCDLACGKHTAHESYLAGMREVVEYVGSHYVVKPDKDSISQFEPYYMIAVKDLEVKIKEWGL